MESFSSEKRIKHYSSYQKILLVGEGDFSFSVCLARAFGLAINMVATSRDSRESLMVNYSRAIGNVEELEARGCIVLHEVDVHSINQHPFLITVLFDRIIYNFPHAGYLIDGFSSEYDRFQIRSHQDLVRGFFRNAREMLTGIGEVHATHKTTAPFSEWKIVELAQEVGLYLVHEEKFSQWDYPGYENKRGDGICDQTFPVGMFSTFKFAKLLYHSTTSCFQFGAIPSVPWPGYSGIINGPYMQRLRNLVMGYFKSSSEIMTRSGEIHVTHKTSFPFNEWEIMNLAGQVGLFLVEEEFSLGDYPAGYKNKRGAGMCDQNFPDGVSSTFTFSQRLYPPTASSFRTVALSISTWSDDIVDMACTYLESLERKKSKRGYKNRRSS